MQKPSVYGYTCSQVFKPRHVGGIKSGCRCIRGLMHYPVSKRAERGLVNKMSFNFLIIIEHYRRSIIVQMI